LASAFIDSCSVHYLLIKNSPKEGRKQVGAVWARRDATPGRIREQSVRAESQGPQASLEEHLRLLELTSAGLWLIDPAGVTRWANEAAGELVGIAPSALVGEHASRFIGDADAALGVDERADLKVTRPDGTSVWLVATRRHLSDESGAPAGTLLTLHDIDERKRREADLRMRLATKEALVNLAELSLDAPDLEAILAESVRMVAEQLDAVLTTVSWVDLERRELWVLAADGHYDDGWLAEIRAGNPIPLAERSFVAAAVESSSPIVVNDFREQPYYDKVLADHGVRSGAFVPLGEGQLILVSLSRQPGASGPSAVALIRSVARLIASYRALIGEAHRRACSASQSGAVRRPLDEPQPAARRGRQIPRRPV
jgi:PAS domain S-box-containing protein